MLIDFTSPRDFCGCDSNSNSTPSKGAEEEDAADYTLPLDGGMLSNYYYYYI